MADRHNYEEDEEDWFEEQKERSEEDDDYLEDASFNEYNQN